MILLCFSIYDKKIEAFSMPFYAPTKMAAIRTFVDAVSDDSPYRKHPEDYCLYECGQFDDAKGVFFAEEPGKLVEAEECLESKTV